MISQEVIIDEDFNHLSLAAQNIFVRILAVSDDYGVVPANLYTLDKLINTPKKIGLVKCLNELVAAKLGFKFPFDGNEFFMFKRDRFDDYQSYLISKRTKSEYLRLSKEQIESKDFQEFLGNYSKSGCEPIKSTKHEVQSIKQKEERATYENKKLVMPDALRENYISTFGRKLFEQEIVKMEKWLEFNKPKKDYNRFIWNWLNRAQPIAQSNEDSRQVFVVIEKKEDFSGFQSYLNTEAGMTGKFNIQVIGDTDRKSWRFTGPNIQHLYGKYLHSKR